MRQTLTQTDVRRLLDEPSAANREETAAKVAAAYSAEALSEDERHIAEDIIRVMTKDTEVMVRAALAGNLKTYSGLSHDIAVKLAGDVDSVALPVIQFSEVLTDDDLLEIVRKEGTAKQTAVAGRPHVSEQVSDALVETGKEDVVVALVGNDGASISDKSFTKVLDTFGENERVNAGMVGRTKLPMAIAERLVNLVSEKLRDELVAQHELPNDVATDLILQSRERATLGLLSPNDAIMDVHALIAQLHKNDRLTPSIILRAICMGDIEFFEISVAVLSRLPLGAARSLIHDEGALGLPAILDRARLPEEMQPMFKAAIDVAKETEYDGGDNDRDRFQRKMLERVLTYMEDPGEELGEENAEYLLDRLCGFNVAGKSQETRAET
tara:strand:- start:24154 stop:25302 length:1149 start_codon:yes stop_codon:yes gene_type:complete